jgi:hypothetical protein
MLAAMKQARERVQALRVALEGPSAEEIGAALPGIQEAMNCLETVEQEFRAGRCASYDVRRELQLLKNDLKVSGRLIEHGVAFCQGWARLLGTGPSYSHAGRPVRDPRSTAVGSLSLEG